MKFRPLTTLPVCSAVSQCSSVVAGRVAITLLFFGALQGFYCLFRSCTVCEDRQASMSIFIWAYSNMLHHLSSGSERHSTVVDRTAHSASTVWAAAGSWRSCISAARYTKP